MKKIILEALKTKFDGVSADILTRIADKLATKAQSEDEAKELAEGVSVQDLLERYGDYRAQQAANKQKPESKPTPEPIPDADPKPQDPKGDEMPEWAKSLKAELDGYKANELANKRLGGLRELIKELPDSLKARYERDFARLTFKDEEDYQQWISELTPDVESIVEDIKKMGGNLSNPKGGGGDPQPTIPEALLKKIEEAKALNDAPKPIKGLGK